MALETPLGPPIPLDDLVARIAARSPARSEADLQADVATLLRHGGLERLVSRPLEAAPAP